MSTRSIDDYKDDCTPDGLYVVVAEWHQQAPIVMETEGPHTSYGEARKRADHIAAKGGTLRTCVARLVYEGGNALLLHDLVRMQKDVTDA